MSVFVWFVAHWWAGFVFAMFWHFFGFATKGGRFFSFMFK